MNPLDPIPAKTKIKSELCTFLNMFNPGDQLRSEDCVKYIRRHLGKYVYDGTILRYMRELRQAGKINYSCTFKRDRIIQVLAPGKPHSF